VARAEELLPSAERDVRKLLAELREEQARLVLEQLRVRALAEEATRLVEERRERVGRFLEERTQLRTRAAREARAILRRAQEAIKKAEQETRESKSTVRTDLARREAHLAAIAFPSPKPPPGRIPEAAKVGERYWSAALAREVEIVREADAAGRVQVVQNGVRVELPLSSLRFPAQEPVSSPERGARERIPVVNVPETEPWTEVHLRGMRADEAIELLDRAVDRAVLSNIRRLRVIHGKGTGALRQAVSDFCKSHPSIAGSRLADQNEGGTGATVIELEGE
jgi:DNA mismatch repair protein MutS2